MERYAAGAPLNPEADAEDLYSPTGAKGYTDFPMPEQPSRALVT